MNLKELIITIALMSTSHFFGMNQNVPLSISNQSGGHIFLCLRNAVLDTIGPEIRSAYYKGNIQFPLMRTDFDALITSQGRFFIYEDKNSSMVLSNHLWAGRIKELRTLLLSAQGNGITLTVNPDGTVIMTPSMALNPKNFESAYAKLGLPVGANPYAILELPDYAPRLQIREAFKLKSMLWHPDRSPHGKEVFPLIAAIYETLKE